MATQHGCTKRQHLVACAAARSALEITGSSSIVASDQQSTVRVERIESAESELESESDYIRGGHPGPLDTAMNGFNEPSGL
jgi:hypothetical protein